MWWNFVARDNEEIVEARAAWAGRPASPTSPAAGDRSPRPPCRRRPSRRRHPLTRSPFCGVPARSAVRDRRDSAATDGRSPGGGRRGRRLQRVRRGSRRRRRPGGRRAPRAPRPGRRPGPGSLRCGQEDRRQPGPLGGEQLLLDAADRQHPAVERDLTGHADVRAHRAPGRQRRQRGDHRDARRRPVLGHRARPARAGGSPRSSAAGVDAELARRARAGRTARSAPTPS